MTTIDIYLAHRNSTKFMLMQVVLIKKYFKLNENCSMNIYGYVDTDNEDKKNIMKNLWIKLGVVPIDIPRNIDGYDRNIISASESFGLAFTYVYRNYILKNNNISVCIENDIFPFTYINIENYVKDYEICGEVRFNASQLPDRNVMFWLGFIIFNGSKMNDREMFSGLCKPIVNINSGRTHWIDSGGLSYYWINKSPRHIRQMVTNGNEEYDGFSSVECTPHNITYDIENLPIVFREDYQPYFRVLVYDHCLIHLERMGKENDNSKEIWWNNCFKRVISGQGTYIPIGFQCTSAEILKKTNKRLCSFPFDWIISNPEAIYKILKLLFSKDCNIESLIKNEFFNIDGYLRFMVQEEFISDDNGSVLYNSKYNLVYPHFKNDIDTKNKMIERFIRLKDNIINSHGKIRFLYINRLVNNNNSIINNSKTKLLINNKQVQFNLLENLNKICLLLDKILGEDRFDILVINAKEIIDNSNIIHYHRNIIYKELVPKNGDYLNDDEILMITI